ncbi:endonuclease G [Mucilaginibacter gossypiicola]|uniref:Endonuclease G n=1 Tax=Mucilaginibacter gossypiicola TaxID=551995 RepID=A0A1H8LSU0_9SPHI|nr:DNA/RNA non-specific endonuclease [Mucilaginibacter gossypiicola]SEO08207.1 endonuclease G [Mucilaginibacter gossypiicola]
MKKCLLSLFFCAAYFLVNAQVIRHHHYTTYYNVLKGEPDSVSWVLTPEMTSCGSVHRDDSFARDPDLQNSTLSDAYVKSGYDKGHLFPYADAQCDSADRIECLYMSNMLPQLHALNAGDWKTLETQEREWAATQEIRIIAGGFGSIGTLPSGVNIPESCWKAIYVDHHWRAWIMPNAKTSKGHPYPTWEVKDITRFDQITGLKL